jgi:xanthine dehydrogenase YagR molybdenum-binding subunit
MMWRKDNYVAYENEGARLEIADKVSGRAKYTTDYYPKGMLYAGYIRCPYGKATLESHDLDAARKVPGVLEVEITREEGRYAGDRMGHLCAESKAAYHAALRALNARWDIGDPKTDAGDLMEDFSFDGAGNSEVAAVLDGAARQHTAAYDTQVQTHCCLEPHIAVVDWRPDATTMAWGSTQSNFGFRDELARELGVDPSEVEFHCEHVGGGFGSKFGAGAEGQLAARMSKKYGKPCRVGLNRKEEHEDAGMRPGSIQYMRVGLDDAGNMVAAQVQTWGLVGYEGGGGGATNPSRYDFGAVDKQHTDVNLNSQPPRAMRAPGHPQGMFGVEMMLDELATLAGMDPMAFRRQNDPNENRRNMLEVGAELIGWDRRMANGQWPGAVKTGFGIGAGDWGNSPGNATVVVNVYRNGTVEVLSGSQDIGTGFRTMLGDCVHAELGMPRRYLRAKCGVSTYPPGPASGGSVTSRFVAPKALNAAQQARRKMLELAAAEWGMAPDNVEMQNGRVVGGGNSMSWEDACKLISDDHLHFSASENGEFWNAPTGSEAVQFAEVQVDTETGIVRVKKIVALQEVGQPVNRHTVENQITGAVIQGLSFALFEERVLNKQTGAMVNPNMDLYKIAGSKDVPEIVPVIWKSREDASVNSLGEPPIIPTPGAIGCAIANAIGTPVRSMPITPAKVLAALNRV